MIERAEEKRPEFPALRVDLLHVALLKKSSEKRLRQVLRVLDRIAAASGVTVERRPVLLAQRGERLARFGRRSSGREHDRPPRGREVSRRPSAHRRASHAIARSISLTNSRASVG